MKELEVTVSVRNNLLLSRRRALGFSQARLAAAAGVPLQAYGAIESMRLAPETKRGWRRIAVALANFYDVAPETLFPEAVRLVKAARMVREMDVVEVAAIGGGQSRIALPDEAFEASQLRDRLTSALSDLPARERKVLGLRFGLDGQGERSLDEVGDTVGVTAERARQIEARAMRLLRHPRRCRDLKAFVVPA